MTTRGDFWDEQSVRGYERLRAYPPLIARQIGQRLAEVVGRGARVLELGVGTGRIAGPLAATGVRVVGIDLSAVMLGRWNAKHGQDEVAVQGDITTLPFKSGSFDAVLAVHVLHLLPNPQPVIAEVRRVLQPGGPLLLGGDWRDPAVIDERVRWRWQQIVLDLQPDVQTSRGSAQAQMALLDHLRAEGAEVSGERALLEWNDRVSAATAIDRITTRQHRESWHLSDSKLQQSVEQLNAWLFSERIDANATTLAQRQFRLVEVRWLES